MLPWASKKERENRREAQKKNNFQQYLNLFCVLCWAIQKKERDCAQKKKNLGRKRVKRQKKKRIFQQGLKFLQKFSNFLFSELCLS